MLEAARFSSRRLERDDPPSRLERNDFAIKYLILLR